MAETIPSVPSALLSCYRMGIRLYQAITLHDYYGHDPRRYGQFTRTAISFLLPAFEELAKALSAGEAVRADGLRLVQAASRAWEEWAGQRAEDRTPTSPAHQYLMGLHRLVHELVNAAAQQLPAAAEWLRLGLEMADVYRSEWDERDPAWQEKFSSLQRRLARLKLRREELLLATADFPFPYELPYPECLMGWHFVDEGLRRLLQGAAPGEAPPAPQPGVVPTSRQPAGRPGQDTSPAPESPARAEVVVSVGVNAYSLQVGDAQPVPVDKDHATIMTLFAQKIVSGSPTEVVPWHALNQAAGDTEASPKVALPLLRQRLRRLNRSVRSAMPLPRGADYFTTVKGRGVRLNPVLVWRASEKLKEFFGERDVYIHTFDPRILDWGPPGRVSGGPGDG
jgi:hypothetical protein